MHFDPAAASAHVTGRILHFVGDPGRSVDKLARREIVTQPAGERHAPPRDFKGRSMFIRASSTRPLLRGSRACRARRVDRTATRPRGKNVSPPGAAVWKLRRAHPTPGPAWRGGREAPVAAGSRRSTTPW